MGDLLRLELGTVESNLVPGETAGMEQVRSTDPDFAPSHQSQNKAHIIDDDEHPLTETFGCGTT